jgi:hypothetical protein
MLPSMYVWIRLWHLAIVEEQPQHFADFAQFPGVRIRSGSRVERDAPPRVDHGRCSLRPGD